jgi:hypothetical protein
MRLLVTDFTRMAAGHICVAGIDFDTGRTVRPVLDGRLPASLASTKGGRFDIRRIVDIGPARFDGWPPETEDHRFDPASCRHERTITGEAFLDRLRAIAEEGLDGFGPGLVEMGRGGRASAIGAGQRSLVVVRATEPPSVYLGERGTIRARLGDHLDLSVTDIRLFDNDFQTPSTTKLDWLRRQLAKPGELFLSLGLSRPFRRSWDDAPRHWLQLNNLHLAVAPDWQLRWPPERYAE